MRDEISDWKRAGVDTVLSLLEPDEEKDLDLHSERDEAHSQGLEFLAFPIPDRQVPKSEAKLTDILERVNRILASGHNVLVHCRQGVGRSGLVAACLLVTSGMSPGAAVIKFPSLEELRYPRRISNASGLITMRQCLQSN